MAKKKNPHAVALGRRGGQARAKNLSAQERTEIARLGGLSGGRGRFDKLSEEERKALASTGGSVGGKARAEKLTPEQRTEIARKAAAKRWGKNNGIVVIVVGVAFAAWKWL